MNSLKQFSLLLAVSFSLIANNLLAQTKIDPKKETPKTPVAKSNSEDAEFTQGDINKLAGEVFGNKKPVMEAEGMAEVYVERVKKTYVQTAKEINAFQATYPNSKSKTESLTLLSEIIKKVDGATQEVYNAQQANVTYTAQNKTDLEKVSLKYKKYLTQLYNTYEAKKKEQE